MKHAAAWAVALACGSLASPSRAADPAPSPPSAQLAEARARYERGMELAAKRAYDQAVVELERAYDLAPSYRILYNVGLAYEALDDYASAARAFERFFAEGGASIAPAQRAEVERRLATLRTRVGKLDVHVDVPGIQIAIDDVVVGKTPLAGPILYKAGHHRVVATREGGVSVTKIVMLAGDETVRVDIDVPEARPLTLDEIEEALARGETERAHEEATHLVLGTSRLEQVQVVRAYRALARASAQLGRAEAARAAYVEILASDASFVEEPAAGEKAMAAFAQASAYCRAQPAPELEATFVAATGGGTLRVTLHDPMHVVSHLEVGHRWRSSGLFATQRLSAFDGQTSAALSAPPLGASFLEYYVVACDERGHPRLVVASESSPRREPFAEAPPRVATKSPLDRPVVWIGAAAVLVAGGIALAYFATRGHDASPAPTQAIYTPSLQCGGGTACN